MHIHMYMHIFMLKKKPGELEEAAWVCRRARSLSTPAYVCIRQHTSACVSIRCVGGQEASLRVHGGVELCKPLCMLLPNLYLLLYDTN